MVDPTLLHTLQAFRAAVYQYLGARRDALFEILDAATTVGAVPSLPYLSLTAPHRRGWGSLYAALAEGRLDVPALRALVGRYPLDDGQPIYALDTSVWPRNDAETSPQRGYYYSAARQSAGQPIDAGYDPESLAQALRDLDGERVAVLVRLRSGRCCYADPLPPPPSRKGGRPRRHGAKFTCQDEGTWWPPTAEHEAVHAQYGQVRVRAWAAVHAQSQSHPDRGTRRPRPIIRGTLVLVEVERLPRQTRIPKRLWLWWRGPGTPDLAVLWRAYVHRFDLEHTYRFCKQVLNWTTPRVRHPEQADRWTWLVLLAYTQLRLARRAIEDVHLPWERPQRPTRRALTPARVRQAFPQLLVALGTPANPPKPCGRSPGRPLGARSGPAPRYPACKKAA